MKTTTHAATIAAALTVCSATSAYADLMRTTTQAPGPA